MNLTCLRLFKTSPPIFGPPHPFLWPLFYLPRQWQQQKYTRQLGAEVHFFHSSDGIWRRRRKTAAASRADSRSDWSLADKVMKRKDTEILVENWQKEKKRSKNYGWISKMFSKKSVKKRHKKTDDFLCSFDFGLWKQIVKNLPLISYSGSHAAL